MPMKRLLISAFLAAIIGSTALHAQKPMDDLRKAVVEVTDIIYDPETSLEEKQKLLVEALEHRFSFPAISRRALGRDWNRLDAGQQERFMELFQELLLHTYTTGLETQRPDERPKVAWLSQRELREGLMEVNSEVTLDGRTFPVGYRLARMEGGWRVYDVIVEGASMVGNYRQQFTSLMRGGNVNQLLSTLERRVDENRARSAGG